MLGLDPSSGTRRHTSVRLALRWLAGDESVQEEDDSSGGAPHQTSAPVSRQAAEMDADISKDAKLQTARQ
jgi:hypothetical protein